MSELEQRAGDVFDLDQLRRLVELMEENELSEIDLRQLDQRIRLTRGAPGAAPVLATSVPVPAPAAPAAPSAPATPAAPAGDPEHIAVVKSPMVGTFYSRPNPEASNYVKVGDHVSSDATICIIEAMKVFNEIPAEVSGEVVAILVDNEEAVEFGTPLFKVDTSK